MPKYNKGFATEYTGLIHFVVLRIAPEDNTLFYLDKKSLSTERYS